MIPLRIVTLVAMPLLILIGTLVAWRSRDSGAERPAWRDDSLDEWRRERDAAAEAERRRRQQPPAASAEADSSRD